MLTLLWKHPESCQYVALSLPKEALRLPKVAGGVSTEEGGGGGGGGEEGGGGGGGGKNDNH